MSCNISELDPPFRCLIPYYMGHRWREYMKDHGVTKEQRNAIGYTWNPGKCEEAFNDGFVTVFQDCPFYFDLWSDVIEATAYDDAMTLSGVTLQIAVKDAFHQMTLDKRKKGEDGYATFLAKYEKANESNALRRHTIKARKNKVAAEKHMLTIKRARVARAADPQPEQLPPGHVYFNNIAVAADACVCGSSYFVVSPSCHLCDHIKFVRQCHRCEKHYFYNVAQSGHSANYICGPACDIYMGSNLIVEICFRRGSGGSMSNMRHMQMNHDVPALTPREIIREYMLQTRLSDHMGFSMPLVDWAGLFSESIRGKPYFQKALSMQMSLMQFVQHVTAGDFAIFWLDEDVSKEFCTDFPVSGSIRKIFIEETKVSQFYQENDFFLLCSTSDQVIPMDTPITKSQELKFVLTLKSFQAEKESRQRPAVAGLPEPEPMDVEQVEVHLADGEEEEEEEQEAAEDLAADAFDLSCLWAPARLRDDKPEGDLPEFFARYTHSGLPLEDRHLMGAVSFPKDQDPKDEPILVDCVRKAEYAPSLACGHNGSKYGAIFLVVGGSKTAPWFADAYGDDFYAPKVKSGPPRQYLYIPFGDDARAFYDSLIMWNQLRFSSFPTDADKKTPLYTATLASFVLKTAGDSSKWDELDLTGYKIKAAFKHYENLAGITNVSAPSTPIKLNGKRGRSEVELDDEPRAAPAVHHPPPPMDICEFPMLEEGELEADHDDQFGLASVVDKLLL